MSLPPLTAIGINAGSGGLVVGLRNAGFRSLELVEPDTYAAETLAVNSPNSRVVRCRVAEYLPAEDYRPFELDLLHARADRPHRETERDDIPRILEMVDALRPKALLLETPPALLDARFDAYRVFVRERLQHAGYELCVWTVYDALQFGGPSPWSVAVLVALRSDTAPFFTPPSPFYGVEPPDVFTLLAASMKQRFTSAAHPDADFAYQRWAARSAGAPVPVLVDLPEDTDEDRYRNDVYAWRACGIEIRRIMSDPQDGLRGPDGPCLTVDQAALVRGFPSDWTFYGPQREVRRQIATASSPLVARALGDAIAEALRRAQEPGAPIVRTPPQRVPGWSAARIDALHHDDFEQFVAGLLIQDGYRVEKAGGGSGDGGIDVLAYDALGYPVIVQCKHFRAGIKKGVSVPVARELFGAAQAMRPHARALLVTNGRFTADCRVWATAEDRIRLIDGYALRQWAADGAQLSDVVRA
ncbi:restriction endonuclease [Streptomyces sp. NPDC059875]|uniref:restriction endonuclease n=1 Tax=unclassified Streptomyces TaxID=2593676 RepID=UPI0036490A8D